ncbi:hypothetical protein ACP4OV_028116 [Aristida adscensionis]
MGHLFKITRLAHIAATSAWNRSSTASYIAQDFLPKGFISNASCSSAFSTTTRCMLGTKQPSVPSTCCCFQNPPDSRIKGFMYEDCTPPDAVDWEKLNVVTKVGKRLGEDCWAHAAVAAVEGVNAIRTGKLIKLSEQQVSDCNDLSNGWEDGGFPHLAFDYITRNGGIVPESVYPMWQAEMVTIDGYQFVPKNCELSLKKAVANQPIAVSICFDELWRTTEGIADDMGLAGELNHSALKVLEN